jgi:hypothetical protein
MKKTLAGWSHHAPEVGGIEEAGRDFVVQDFTHTGQCTTSRLVALASFTRQLPYLIYL